MNLFYKYLLVLPTHIIINMNSKITTQEFKDYLISNHIPFSLTSKGEPDKRSSTVRKYYDKLYYEKYISQEVDKRLSVKQKIDNFVYNEEQENMECPICFDKIVDNVAIIGCSHKFCLSCYSMHIRENNNCPMCRSEICDKPKKLALLPKQQSEYLIQTLITREEPQRENLSLKGYYKHKIIELFKRFNSHFNPEAEPTKGHIQILVNTLELESKLTMYDLDRNIRKYYRSFV